MAKRPLVHAAATRVEKSKKAFDTSILGTRYDDETRSKIHQAIVAEWNKVGSEMSSGDSFVQHMQRVLDKAGFKSPMGEALSERTVRFQIRQAGIRFRGTRKERPVYTSREEELNDTQAPASFRPTSARSAVENNSNGTPVVPQLVKMILEDDSMEPAAQIEMIKTYYRMK